MPFAEVQMAENVIRTEDLGGVVSPTSGVMSTASPEVSPHDIQQELEKALAPEIHRRTLSVDSRRQGVVVSLREVGFYDSGSATVKPEGEEALQKIAAILGPRPDFVRVEGHTDNVPIHTPKFASNWELSTARATELVRSLTTRYGISAERLSAAGYAEFHPVASNATVEGRAMNRRVDLVIVAAPAHQNVSSGVDTDERPTAPSSTTAELRK